MPITAGIDVGSGAIKVVLFEVEDGSETLRSSSAARDSAGNSRSSSTERGSAGKWLGKRVERVRQRDPLVLAAQVYDGLLAGNGLKRSDVGYCATTGEGEALDFHTGYFYSMTAHARGAIYLRPGACAVLDVGALHGRAIRIDGRGKVLTYKMTSQCASGSGQFLENIARYLGIAQGEIGSLSKQGTNPEQVSGICAVLAETDSINMVSRGIAAPNILRGIHESMASRLAKLLKTIGKLEGGAVQMTGGLALDDGLVSAMQAALEKEKLAVPLETHADAIYAGAIGAALWGAFRWEKLQLMGVAASAA